MKKNITFLMIKFFMRNKQGSSEVLRTMMNRYYRVKIGLYTYGGCFSPTFNQGGAEVSVGRYCSFAPNVHYYGANHPLNYITTSPYFYNKNFGGFEVRDVERSKLAIGNDVWIGDSVCILDGCRTIGTGAVVGAGSIITKDVPPFAIVAGNPAKIIRFRFSEDERQRLLCSKWWERKPKELMRIYDSFASVNRFVDNLEALEIE